MSKRTDGLLVLDMLEAIEKILQYTRGLNETEFLQNSEKSDAVIRNIEVIGEAASNLSRDFQRKHVGVPWRQIVGMRNRLIHGYFGVSLKTIWQVVCIDLPRLYEDLKSLGAIFSDDQ